MKDRTKFNCPATQWIHDNAPHTFHLSDIDAFTLKLATGIGRAFEFKHPREPLHNSQEDVFGFLVAHDIPVFVVWWEEGQFPIRVMRWSDKREYILSEKHFIYLIGGQQIAA